MSLTRTQARRIVLDYFNHDVEDARNFTYALVDEHTLETSYGWIFDLSTKEYLETGDVNYHLIGINSVVVEKNNQSINILGTQYSREIEVKIYEIERLTFLPTFLRVIAVSCYVIIVHLYSKLWSRTK